MDNTVSLLYPNGYRSGGSSINQRTVESLELRYIAMLICPYNTEFALSILTDFVTHERLIAWQQDILEDPIALPQLEILLYRAYYTQYIRILWGFMRVQSRRSRFLSSWRVLKASRTLQPAWKNVMNLFVNTAQKSGLRA